MAPALFNMFLNLHCYYFIEDVLSLFIRDNSMEFSSLVIALSSLKRRIILAWEKKLGNALSSYIFLDQFV
jgi:hypothetical protein